MKGSRNKTKISVNIYLALLTSLHTSFQWLPAICQIKCLLFTAILSFFPSVSPSLCTGLCCSKADLFKNMVSITLPTRFCSGYFLEYSLSIQLPVSSFGNFINTDRLISRSILIFYIWCIFQILNKIDLVNFKSNILFS